MFWDCCPEPRAPAFTEIDGGESFCEAYETYMSLHETSCVSFEHASFLMLALWRRDELELARCEDCARLFLHDVLSGRKPRCNVCRSTVSDARKRRRPESDAALLPRAPA